MRCPRCGKELKDTALFCSRCGSKINSTSRINPVVANRASITGKYRDNEKSDSSGFGLNPVTLALIALIAILLAGAAFAVMDTGDSGDDDGNEKVVIFSDKSVPVEKFGNTYQISNIYNLNAYYFAFLNMNLYDFDVLAFVGNPIGPNHVEDGNDSNKHLKEVVTVPEVEDSDDDDSSSEDSDGISDLSELLDSSASSDDSSASSDDSSASSDDSSASSDDSSADDSSSNDDESSKSDSSSEESSKPDINTITIESVDVTGGENDEPAECEIHVGSEYAGCEVNVSALYSSGDQYVNDGKPVTKTVDSDGNITIKSSLNAGSDGMMIVDLVNVTIFEPDGDEICFYEQQISIEIGSMEDASSDSSSSSGSSYDDSSYDDSYYDSYDDSSYDDSFYEDEYFYDDEYYY